MSNCKITFKIGGRESIELSVDSSLLPKDYTKLKSLIKQLNLFEKLLDDLKNVLRDRKSILDVDLDSLINSHYLIPNATISDLKSRFPSEQFPDDTPELKISNKKVLFVNKYKTKSGKLLYGRVVNKNGEEIFIVDAAHIKQLVNYFTFLKQISSSPILSLISDSTAEQIDKIYTKVLKNDKLKLPLLQYILAHETENMSDDERVRLQRESLLILFSQNKTPFRQIVYNYNNENIGAYVTLNNLCEDILEVSHKKKLYSDRTLDNLVKSISKYSDGFKEAYVSKEFVIKILPKQISDKLVELGYTNKDNSLSYKKINEELNKSVKENRILFNNLFGLEVVSNYDEDADGWNILILEILSKDKTFNFNYKSQDGKTITLKKFLSTLESSYGIGYEDLLEYDNPEYYNGKYILSKTLPDETLVFYVTDYYTKEFLYAQKFDSIVEAKNYIDNNLKAKVIENSYKQLHALNLDSNGKLLTNDKNNLSIYFGRYVPEKSVLTILDYDVPSLDLDKVPMKMHKFISNTFEEATVEDFINSIDKNELFYLHQESKETVLKHINTPEKIFLFISLLNNEHYTEDGKIDLTDELQIVKLAEEIGSINKYRYYYVRSYNNKNSVVNLSKFDPKILPEYRKDDRYPIKKIWKAAEKVLSPILGKTKLKVMSDEEIKEMLGDRYEFNAKAFIKGGDIYINSDRADIQDLCHEYVHIVMAMLKTNDSTKERYVLLLQKVWDLGLKDAIRARIQEKYGNYAFIDLMEEYFVTKFGNWIKNNSDAKFSNIFSSSDILKEGTKSIFDKDNKSKSIEDIYGKKISEILLGFNSDIGLYLATHKSLADGHFSKLFTLSRKKTLWLRQLISEGKLTETNCV